MLDVLIQTFNEEVNLPHTLRSLEGGWVNRVFVVDSGSTDATMAIARDWGATVVEHAWEGYARQKNWAIDHLPFEADWVLIVDADEAVSDELRDELVGLTGRPAASVREAAFNVNRVFVFNGRKIWHCGYFPSWNMRLFKRGMARYEDRAVHEHMICDGPSGDLRGLLVHEDRRGLENFFAKHNRYSTLEARELFNHPEPWPGLRAFADDTTRRRRFIKSRVLPRVPLPWLLRFVYMYFGRLGILDGAAGLELSRLISVYELLIRSKYREVQRLVRLHGRAVALGAAGVGGAAPAAGRSLANPEGSVAVLAKLPRGGGAGRNGAVPAITDIPGVVRGPDRPAAVLRGEADGDARSRGEALYAGAARSDDPAESAKPFGGGRAGLAPVSVVIPTLNEAGNLRRCLDHLTWADEVVVVDSGSKDDTVAIAREYGAKVVDFRWNGRWPKKKNWALRHAPLANDWVLIVDADEWITPELAAEIGRRVAAPGANVGFYVNRRFIFMGRWIRHCGYYPSWNLRLLKRGHGEYERLTDVGNTGSGDNEVHEHVVPRGGSADYLDHDMLHFAFPNIHTFMEKHNRYSNWEAIVQYQGEAEGKEGGEIGGALARRRRLKNLSRRLPFRPALRFLYSYVYKLGFLDGRAGLVFCRLLAIYEYLSVAKHLELKRAEADLRQARALSDVPPALEHRPEPAAAS